MHSQELVYEQLKTPNVKMLTLQIVFVLWLIPTQNNSSEIV